MVKYQVIDAKARKGFILFTGLLYGKRNNAQQALSVVRSMCLSVSLLF